MYNTAEIIKRIEMRLAEIGLPKEEFYKQVGISSATFSYWNTGKHSPRTKALQKISETLGISMHYLLTGEEEQKNKPTDNGELSQKDIQLVNWFHSLPKETRQAILTLGAAPKGLDD